MNVKFSKPVLQRGRLITFLKIAGEKIYLLSVYDKSEIETVSDQYIKFLLKDLK